MGALLLGDVAVLAGLGAVMGLALASLRTLG